MHKFLEKLKKELKELEDKPSLSAGEWQRVQMLSEIKKNILETKMLEEGGEDESYEQGYSERRMRDSRGRFRSSYGYDGYEGGGTYRSGSYGGHEGGSYEGGGAYRGGSYGAHEGKHEMLRDLEGMLGRCESQQDKETIRRWIKQLEE